MLVNSVRFRVFVSLLIAVVVGGFYISQYVTGHLPIAAMLVILTMLVFTYLLLVTLIFSVRPRIPIAPSVLSPDLMKRMVEHAKDAIIVADHDQQIIYWNEAAKSVFGYTKKEALAMTLSELMPEELRKQYLERFGKFSHTGKGYFAGSTQEVVALRKNHQTFRANLSVSGVELSPGKWGAVAMLRDETGRKRMEEENKLERQHKRELISIVAHQLKDPLAAVRWQIELLLEDETLSADTREAINGMYDQVHSMNRLIGDLLQSSRIESGRVKALTDRVDISALTESVVAEMKEVDGFVTRLVEHITPGLFAVVDANLFRQVELNLIENALKYSGQDQKVDVFIERKDDRAMIRVVDRGIGIREQDKSHIFQRFFRAENAMEKQIDGTGLGLFIAKQFTARFDGTISFESKEGEGTTFIIQLPLV